LREKFLVFGAPDLQAPELNEVNAVLASGWLGTGPRVAQFQSEFARYKGVSGAAAVNSCTAALHLSLIAAGIEPGDEVITTPMSFCATVNCIIHAGGIPVLADVDPASMNIDADAVAARITPRTRAILIVHFAGRACEMDALCAIAAKHDLTLIEDCAHAIETQYRGRSAGTFGDFGCFSFYVTKNVVTGEGGMVLARRPADLERIAMLALHGMSKDAWKRFSAEGFRHYEVVECGFKYNMMDLQAALGIHQLRRVAENWERRRRIWEMYMEAFADMPIGLPSPETRDARHALHLYTILVDPERTRIERDAFLQEMTRRRIGVGVHYRSLPEQPYYQQRFGWRPAEYPHATRIGQQTLSLPLGSGLRDSDVADVVGAVREVLRA
jgi:dTDP-4-amino-4,6-dideoxygalactose transaminase